MKKPRRETAGAFSRQSQILRRRVYNPRMDAAPAIRASDHDETLLDWFLSLDPCQRLAELESRLTFFNSVRCNDDAELSPDT
jgi:hypothetical protein